MANKVKVALEMVLGLPLSDAKSAAGMPMFAFGDLVTVGVGKQIGSHALHVMCPWRLLNESKIIVGDTDSSIDLDTELPGTYRRTLFHQRIESFFASTNRNQLIVSRFALDVAGGFKMILSGGIVLEVVPMTSAETEIWRIFGTGDNEPHYVCLSTGCVERC